MLLPRFLHWSKGILPAATNSTSKSDSAQFFYQLYLAARTDINLSLD